MKDKRGLVGSMPEWIPRALALSVVLLMIVLLVGIYTNRNVDTRQAQAEVLFNRMVYSQGLFWDTDELNNSLPGVVVLDRFEDEVLEDEIRLGSERYAAAKLSLLGESGNVIKVAYLNRRGYDRWEPLAEAGVGDSGGATLYRKRMPVTILDENKSGGTLDFRIIIPHS